jgi:hypothetical protein
VVTGVSISGINEWREFLLFPTVDNFVAERASDFKKVQQTSTSKPQLPQQQSLRINKNL